MGFGKTDLLVKEKLKKILSSVVGNEVISTEMAIKTCAYFFNNRSTSMGEKKQLPFSFRAPNFDRFVLEKDGPLLEEFIDICPDIFSFIKNYLDDLVVDFSLAEQALLSANNNQKNGISEALLLLPLMALNLDKNNPREVNNSLNKINAEFRDSKLKLVLTKDDFEKFLKSISGFFLSNDYKKIDASVDVSDDKMISAYDAVLFLKNEMKITNNQTQLRIARLFYSGLKSASKIWGQLDKRDYQYLAESERQLLLNKMVELLKLFQKTTPQFFLEAFYVSKKRSPNNDSYSSKKVSSPLECSLAYSIFTKNLSLNSNALIFFPSPFFIRKYASDRFVGKTNTVFVLPSEEEKILWEIIFKKNTYREKRDQYSFYSVNGFISKASTMNQSITDIFVNSLSNWKYDAYSDGLSYISNLLEEKAYSARVVCLSPNKAFEFNTSFPGAFIKRNRVEEIVFLPNSVENEGRGKKKNLWIGHFNHEPSISMCYLSSFNGKTGVLEIKKDPENYKLFLAAYYMDSKKTDILAYAKKSIEKKPNKKYQSATSYEYSPEIIIKYTSYNLKKYPDKIKVRAYCQIRGKTINKNAIFKELDKDKLNEWLEKDCVFEEIGKGKKKEDTYTIREIMSPVLKEAYKNQVMSLRSFVYAYPELESNLSYEEYKFVRLIAFDNSLGKTMMSILNEDSLYGTEYGHLLSTDEDIKNWFFGSLGKTLNYAIAKGHLNYNPFDPDGELNRKDTDYYIRQLVSIRSKMTPKTFSIEQFRKFYRKAKEELTTNNGIYYLGLLIATFTGLSLYELVVLKWEDIKVIKHFGGHQFQIYKKYDPSKKKEIEPYSIFEKSYQFRCIPCIDSLYKILKRWKKQATNRRDEDFILSLDGKKPINTERISEAFRAITSNLGLDSISKLSIDENFIFEKPYQGNFLRENLRFMSTDIAGLTVDEISFLLGNVPQTTFGTYYCDYFNPASQFVLLTKLNRIDAILNNKSDFSSPSKQIITNTDEVTLDLNNTTKPIQINLIKENKLKNDSITMTVTSDFGFEIYQSEENYEEL